MVSSIAFSPPDIIEMAATTGAGAKNWFLNYGFWSLELVPLSSQFIL
jgi:hypothetical protein